MIYLYLTMPQNYSVPYKEKVPSQVTATEVSTKTTTTIINTTNTTTTIITTITTTNHSAVISFDLNSDQ